MRQFLLVILFSLKVFAQDEITPNKQNDIYAEIKKSTYVAPACCTFRVERPEHDAPSITYYLSQPQPQKASPIAILCTGSSSKDFIHSVIHFHRYFLQEFQDAGCAVMTLEQWGVEGQNVDEEVFWQHYTRMQRLQDHEKVIEHVLQNPPDWWNGKFVLLGVSEGGPLVTSLTQKCHDDVLATINWCGAGDWSWRDELWVFIKAMKRNASWWQKILFYFIFPRTRAKYDQEMDKTLADPCADKDFMGMSYKYHADALNYSEVDYKKLLAPFLVIAGAHDSIIDSCDEFVNKAQKAGANITYMRIEGIDHYIRKRPDIIKQTFDWLKEAMKTDADS